MNINWYIHLFTEEGKGILRSIIASASPCVLHRATCSAMLPVLLSLTSDELLRTLL